MRLAPGRPRVALIVAPHPDDEVIGAAGLIRLLARRGVVVRVLIVTDGAGSHPASASWPRRRLLAERRRESRRALRRLAVDASAVAFLDLPDGGLSTVGQRCRRAVARAIRATPRLDLIVGPAADDAHPDHRAVAAAIRAAPGRARRIAYRIWPPHPMRRGRLLTLAGSGLAKRSLIGLYRTQLGAIRDDAGGFAIARHELDAFAHAVERYRAPA